MQRTNLSLTPLLILTPLSEISIYYELDYHFFKVIARQENRHESYGIVSLFVSCGSSHG